MERKNLIKRCLFLICLAVIFLVMIMIMARYEEEGEKEIPFNLSKILIVSSVDGKDIDDPDNIWNIDVSQVNDVYVYLDRKEDEECLIKSITFENFKNLTNLEKDLKIYRPTGELEKLYTYSEENYKDKSLSFTGELIDDMKNLEISNIGGMCGFRVANENIGKYISNEEDQEIIYDGRLLEKVGIVQEDIKLQFSFDIIVETNEDIKYKGTIILDMPGENLGEEGKSKIEINDFSNVVFKRI